ncbi:S-layer homology domain-containing protein, partial [Thermoanaerobacter thermohydrosulfuricus]
STYGVFEYNKEFKDVTKDNWAYDVVNVLASRHIIKGVDSETFVPNAKITRAEFAALMIRALGIEEEPYKGEFNDVREGAWYANAIEAAYKAGIMLGDGKNMRPDDPITREEMTAVIMRVYGKLAEYKEDSIGNTTFSDNNNISEWAKNVVANAVKLGIVRGYEDNTFKPKDNATRAEAAAMLYRILEKTGNI